MSILGVCLKNTYFLLDPPGTILRRTRASLFVCFLNIHWKLQCGVTKIGFSCFTTTNCWMYGAYICTVLLYIQIGLRKPTSKAIDIWGEYPMYIH
jgi:hypothetical protein